MSFSEQISKNLVRVRCKTCLYEAPVAEFQYDKSLNFFCPHCQEKINLIMILDDGREVDLSIGRKKIPLQLMAIIFGIGIVAWLAYQSLPLIYSGPIFIIAFIVCLILAYNQRK